MLCKNCTLKKICKVYELHKSLDSDIIVQISSCNFNIQSKQIKTGVQAFQELKKDSFDESFNQEEYDRLMKKINGEPVEDINNVIIECRTCGGKDYLSELKACSKCNKEVCGNCGTSDNGQVYCQECWGEM